MCRHGKISVIFKVKKKQVAKHALHDLNFFGKLQIPLNCISKLHSYCIKTLYNDQDHDLRIDDEGDDDPFLHQMLIQHY